MNDDFLLKDILLLWSALGVIFIIFVCFLTWNTPPDNAALTYEKCCGGHFCTDTYYSKQKDKCVLSLCENSIFVFNKSKCEYKPK